MTFQTLLENDSLSSPTWGDDLLAALTNKDEEGFWKRIEGARSACEEDGILHDAKAIAHPRWADIVRACIAATPAFEDIAEDVYEVRVAFEDDEGHLCQGWEEYVTVGAVSELLRNPATFTHPEWSTLCVALLTMSAKDGNSFEISDDFMFPIMDEGGDWASLVPAHLEADRYDFIGEMLTRDEVLSHPDLLTWLDPLKNYVMMIDAVTNTTAQDHEVFPQLVDLIKMQPNIRQNRSYEKFTDIVKAKLGTDYI